MSQIPRNALEVLAIKHCHHWHDDAHSNFRLLILGGRLGNGLDIDPEDNKTEACDKQYYCKLK
ncbi:hypothetical protein PHLCEN_2v13116 [Hermanssonia centrifuga]|uniref:Uncharacterized protein n=1 Tax=Hermanssonia centrifuga TaxID=98765 RepID=A0A2R6NGA2_9APHY|nr:hypothetical protein PHLCEN_2v13116 [Hermanssonia centrifuga]